ncbi:MAG: M28 family peptidase [Candidatus Korobacteraceae bacterium]
MTTCVIGVGIATCEDLKYLVVGRDTVMGRLKDAPKGNSDRALELEKMFREAGCRPSKQPVQGLHEPNVLCVLPGSSSSVIVVGGHLDHVEHGDGTVDDWSGASMLPSLYQSLAGQPRTHTFLFLGFAGEEEGLVGSDFYVKHLTVEERKQIAAMVNLECLGLTTTKVWTSHSDDVLVRMLVAMARWSHAPLLGVNVERVGTTDSESFARYKIPRITIHSLTQENLTLLHSKDDNIKAIKPDVYYDSYRLIAPYLVLLDQQLPTSPTAAH